MASNETIGSSIPSTETTKFPFPGCVVFQNKKVRHDFNNTAGEKRKERRKRCENKYVSFDIIK